jgi:hypothetical protein
MKRRRVLLPALMLLLGMVAPVSAQTWRMDIGANGGGSAWTGFLGDDDTGNGSLGFASSWVAGVQATYWVSTRLGARLNLTGSSRGPGSATSSPAAASADDIGIFAGTLDVLFRLSAPQPVARAGQLLPYVAGGLGARYVNPAYDVYELTSDDGTRTGHPFTVEGGNGRLWFLTEGLSPAALLAVGTDVRLPRSFFLRLELGDRIARPAVYPASRTGEQSFAATGGQAGRWTHELQGTLGVHVALGARAAEPVLAALPAPIPAPVPPAGVPADTTVGPPPADTTRAEPAAGPDESLSLCVIDPAQPSGVRTIEATYRPSARDTIVVLNELPLPVADAIGQVENRPWLAARRPLDVPGTRPGRFVIAGAPRSFGDAALVQLGMSSGMPIFVEVAAMESVVDRLGTAADLAIVLTDSDIEDAFARVNTIFVPYRTIGCLFQPLQRQ